ncbi:M48 family metalloprotease [Salmonirosea aquatica]|uniref:M48 family metalloprotease n=1 Tax=Salmonirosea aquatica TaxID=2654236 RepID=A0A7C9FQ48_9BACT|nr:M48 family metalloprotease [Cytophagaceae bacterium SJW1-29]
MKKIASLYIVILGLMASQLAQAQINPNLVQAGIDALMSATITNAQIAEISKEAVKEMDAKNPVAPASDAYTKRLNRIVSRYRTISGIPLNYKVYKVPDVNAFATADGSVRVFQGLMDIMNDKEILAIIGHEIGHVVNHDSHDAAKSALRRSALRNAVAANDGVLGKLSRSELGGLADYMASASFSRQQETDADDFSYAFLKRNGQSVLALATSFEKLDKAGGGKVPQFLSTHPDSKARAARVRARAKQEGVR